MATIRNVSVMMSFGGNDPALQRQSVLKFLRVRHLIENKVKMSERGTGDPITYKVDRQEVAVDKVTEIMKQLVGADVLIGILTEKNVNVIYEVATRNMLKGHWILLTDGNVDLPIYLQSFARSQIDHETAKVVTTEIPAVAAKLKSLHKSEPLPEDLRQAIDEYDGYLEKNLQEALWEVEHRGLPQPAFEEFMEGVDQGDVLRLWHTWYPYCIWRIQWRGKPRAANYSPGLMIGDPVLFGANNYVASMLQMSGGHFPPAPHGPEALTLQTVLEILRDSGWVDPCGFELFMKDITALGERLMAKPREVGYLGTQLHHGLRFRDHPDPNFRGKSIMPCLMARRTIGPTEQPHVTYLLVVFVELDEMAGDPDAARPR